jgi:membrane-bound ClpP family serine protease
VAALSVLLLISGLALVLAELAPPTHGVFATTGVAAVIAGIAIDGELWRARRSWASEDEAPEAGDTVIVDRVDGLTLSVRPAEVWELEP